MALHPMVTVTYLPLFVTILFRGMPGMWKSRHRLVLCWLVVMQALWFCRKVRFLGKIQKSGIRNSMTYRLPIS